MVSNRIQDQRLNQTSSNSVKSLKLSSIEAPYKLVLRPYNWLVTFLPEIWPLQAGEPQLQSNGVNRTSSVCS